MREECAPTGKEQSCVNVNSIAEEYVPRTGKGGHTEDSDNSSENIYEGEDECETNTVQDGGNFPSYTSADIILSDSVRVTHAISRKNYVAYRIQCCYEGRYWTIARRYRNFAKFHTRLVREGVIPEDQLPILPKKRVFTRMRRRFGRVLPGSPSPPSPTQPERDEIESGEVEGLSPGHKGDVPGQKPRLEQLGEYVTALFALPPSLVHSSLVMRRFFELSEKPLTLVSDMEDDGDGVSPCRYERAVSTQGMFANSMMLESKLLDAQTVHKLRIYMGFHNAGAFRLCFSTFRDGWSLDTLYALTAHRAPCIILVLSLESQALVGAFLPVAISPPSHDVRGDGQSFVFRLDGDRAACFKWESHDEAYIAGMGGFGSSSMQAHMQFAMCSYDHIAVGGSSVYGTNALRIDTDLQTCFSGPTDTFNNPSLVPEESRQPFAIGRIFEHCNACD